MLVEAAGLFPFSFFSIGVAGGASSDSEASISSAVASEFGMTLIRAFSAAARSTSFAALARVLTLYDASAYSRSGPVKAANPPGRFSMESS